MKIVAADRHFSRLVRMRARWKCERCGVDHSANTGALDCSHFYGRSSTSTRWHQLNAVAHCYGCHSYLGSRPVEFREWMIEKRGADVVDRLEYIHHLRVKIPRCDWPVISKDLLAQTKVMDLGDDFETPAVILMAIERAEQRRR